MAPAPFHTIFDTAFTATLSQDLASRTLEIIRNLHSQPTTKELKPTSRYNKRLLAADATAGSPNGKKRSAVDSDGEDEESDPLGGGVAFTTRGSSGASGKDGKPKAGKVRKTVSFVSAAPHSLGSGIVGDIMRRRQKLQQEQLEGGGDKEGGRGGKTGKQQPQAKTGGKNGKADAGNTYLRHRCVWMG